MGRSTKAVAMFVMVLLMVGGVVFGYREGSSRTRAAALRDAGNLAAVEAKILEVIVKRNPDAAIRDFADFPAHLLQVAAETRIDFRLAMAMIDAESEWRPRAVGAKGEIGLLQVRPPTAALVAKRLGMGTYKPPTSAKHGYADLGTLGDTKQNIRLGLTYLAWQRDEFGPSLETVRAFNRGPARARERWDGDVYAERVGLRLVALVQEFR